MTKLTCSIRRDAKYMRRDDKGRDIPDSDFRLLGLRNVANGADIAVLLPLDCKTVGIPGYLVDIEANQISEPSPGKPFFTKSGERVIPTRQVILGAVRVHLSAQRPRPPAEVD